MMNFTPPKRYVPLGMPGPMLPGSNQRDTSPRTIKKSALNLEILQSEIDMVKHEIQSQIMRQNEFRLRTIQKELNSDLYSDISANQKELAQARMMIQQLQLDNQTLMRELDRSRELERTRGRLTPLEATPKADQNDEVRFLKAEVQRLKELQLQLKNSPEEGEQQKDAEHWKENCNKLLIAQEEILQSNQTLATQLNENQTKISQQEQMIQMAQTQQNQLKAQVQQLSLLLQDRDQQISSFRQIMAQNPKVMIKFPPCLRIQTTAMNSPVRDSRSPSPMQYQQQRNLTPRMNPRAESNLPNVPENIYIKDCYVPDK